MNKISWLIACISLLAIQAYGVEDILTSKAGMSEVPEKDLYAQAFALCYALKQPGHDILRSRIRPGMINVAGLAKAGVKLDQQALREVIFRPVAIDAAEKTALRNVGWPWPRPLESFSITTAHSIKTRKLVPVCLVRLHHEPTVWVRSDSTTSAPPEHVRSIYDERFISQWDPFSGSLIADNTEYVLLVQDAPAEHPFVKKLSKALGPQVRIVMQMLPNGRAGLATLAYSRWWAGVAMIDGAPGHSESLNMLMEGWQTPFGLFGGVKEQRESVRELHKDMFDEISKMPEALDAEQAYPDAPMALPNGLRLSVPAPFLLGDMDDIWQRLKYANIGGDLPSRNLTTKRLFAVAVEFWKNPELIAPGGELALECLRDFKQLPMPITRERRCYPVPHNVTPAKWLTLIQESCWGSEFSPPGVGTAKQGKKETNRGR